jgi:hypothetical protein
LLSCKHILKKDQTEKLLADAEMPTRATHQAFAVIGGFTDRVRRIRLAASSPQCRSAGYSSDERINCASMTCFLPASAISFTRQRGY